MGVCAAANAVAMGAAVPAPMTTAVTVAATTAATAVWWQHQQQQLQQRWITLRTSPPSPHIHPPPSSIPPLCPIPASPFVILYCLVINYIILQLIL